MKGSGYHFVQSFSPDDHLTPEQVHEIGCKTMKEYLGSSAEFIHTPLIPINHTCIIILF